MSDSIKGASASVYACVCVVKVRLRMLICAEMATHCWCLSNMRLSTYNAIYLLDRHEEQHVGTISVIVRACMQSQQVRRRQRAYQASTIALPVCPLALCSACDRCATSSTNCSLLSKNANTNSNNSTNNDKNTNITTRGRGRQQETPVSSCLDDLNWDVSAAEENAMYVHIKTHREHAIIM